MRILITGATGFVGKNLIPKIMKSKFKNIGIELALLNYENFHAIELYSKFKQIKNIDLLKNDYKEKIKEFNPEIILHMASFLTSRDDEESIKKLLSANIEFGTNLLDALNETDIKYFINIGTFAEYYYNDGELKSAYLYAATKTAFRTILEYYQRKIGFKWINIIPYTIYGGEDSQKKVIDYIISSLNTLEKIDMSKGEQRLDFIHVYDVVEFFIKLISKIELIKEDYIQFELGTGKGTTIKEVAEIIEEVFGEKTNINWGGLPYRDMDMMQAIAHTTKIREKIKWIPKIDLIDGIKLMKKGKK